MQFGWLINTLDIYYTTEALKHEFDDSDSKCAELIYSRIWIESPLWYDLFFRPWASFVLSPVNCSQTFTGLFHYQNCSSGLKLILPKNDHKALQKPESISCCQEMLSCIPQPLKSTEIEKWAHFMISLYILSYKTPIN